MILAEIACGCNNDMAGGGFWAWDIGSGACRLLI